MNQRARHLSYTRQPNPARVLIQQLEEQAREQGCGEVAATDVWVHDGETGVDYFAIETGNAKPDGGCECYEFSRRGSYCDDDLVGERVGGCLLYTSPSPRD